MFATVAVVAAALDATAVVALLGHPAWEAELLSLLLSSTTSIHSPGPLGGLFVASTLGCSGVGCDVGAGFLVTLSFAKCPAAPQIQQ